MKQVRKLVKCVALSMIACGLNSCYSKEDIGPLHYPFYGGYNITLSIEKTKFPIKDSSYVLRIKENKGLGRLEAFDYNADTIIDEIKTNYDGRFILQIPDLMNLNNIERNLLISKGDNLYWPR